MANGDQRGPSPPYVPWVTFKSFMEELGGATVPNAIDGSVFRGKSGSTQSELRGALRFFGLTEGEDNTTTDRLHDLVAAASDSDLFKSELQTLLPTVYGPILESLDLQRGTRAQLDAAFEERGGVTGSAKKKAVRFFLSAMTEAGLPLSPHFGADRARASPGRRPGNGRGTARQKAKKPATTATVDETPESGSPDGAAPSGLQKVLCTIPGRTVQLWLPADLTAPEQDFVLMFLKGYFALTRGGAAQE